MNTHLKPKKVNATNPSPANLLFEEGRWMHEVVQNYLVEAAERKKVRDEDDGGLNFTCPYCNVAMTLLEFDLHEAIYKRGMCMEGVDGASESEVPGPVNHASRTAFND